MSKSKKEMLYHVHNLTRSVATRLTRAKTARRTRNPLLLSGGDLRVPRGRYGIVTKSKLLQMVVELKKKESAGALKVTTATGQRINLDDFSPVEGRAKESLPHPPLDSAANDKTYEGGVGEGQATMYGGKALQEDVKVPEVLKPEIPEGKEDTADFTQAIYDSATAKVLASKAESMGLATDGSKRDVSARLSAAGYRPE